MMKKFHFRLQAPLEVAMQRERGVQQELARAHAIEAQRRQECDTIEMLRRECDELLRRCQRGQIDANRLRELHAAAQALSRRAVAAREALRATERMVEEVRQRLTEAAKGRRSLERLRERSFEEYQHGMLNEQTKLADEMTAVRAASAKAAGRHDLLTTGASA